MPAKLHRPTLCFVQFVDDRVFLLGKPGCDGCKATLEFGVFILFREGFRPVPRQAGMTGPVAGFANFA